MLRLGSSCSGKWLLADIGGEPLDLGEDLQGSLWACTVPFGFEAHAHHAVEGQGQEADERMGADAVRQAMVNRGDLDVGFEDSKSSLDIGEPLVARDGRSGTDVRGVGDQRERAVAYLRFGHGGFIHRPGDPSSRALCNWKTRFARSMPMMVTPDMDVLSFCDGFNTQHSTHWHIAMPSGGGIHAINRAVTQTKDLEFLGQIPPMPSFASVLASR